ncbi:MAG TPA: POTRA domain-containing protein, partial [Polyangiales bacterium]
MRRLFLFALSFGLCTGLGWRTARAELPDELRGQRIVSVRVAGESAQIAQPDVTGVTLGERLGREVVRNAIARLLASKRWVDVQVEAQRVPAGVMLLFHLEPRITLRRVDVRGQDQVDEQVVRDSLGVGAGSEARTESLPTLAAAVTKAYAERGYLGTRVAVRFRDTDDPSQKVLLVEIDEGGPTRITRLTFSGDRPDDPARAFSAMGLHEGDVLNRRVFAAALIEGERDLRSRNYLEARIGNPVITIRADQAELTFPLHLGPRYTLQVIGATPLRETEIAGAFLLIDAPLTVEAIDAMPAHIKDLYAKNGFPDARVAVERKMVSSARARLVARIEPGHQLTVVDVSFAGAQHYTTQFLRDQLESYLDEDLPGGGPVTTVDSEVAARVIHGEELDPSRQTPRPQEQAPSQTYYAPTYIEALKHIAELYQADGYLSAQIGPALLQYLPEHRATVNIPVTEGPRTLLHGVVLTGQEHISSQQLLVTSGLVRNAPFSYLSLEEARLRMQQLYQERGYMFVRIEPSVRFSSDRTRAEVTFQIIERFPVRISEVVVRGADRTGLDFIRSLLAIKPGDLFRPSKARESEIALSSLGVLTGVSVELEDPDLPARVKRLVVIVSERRNQFLDFSAGLSTGQGARAGFDYGYRNLFGRGVGLTLRVQFAYQLLFVRQDLRERFDRLLFSERLERNVALGLVVPRSPGLGATRTNLDLVHVRDNERDFGLDKNGITLAFTEVPIPHVAVVEAVDLENNNIDLFEAKALADLLAVTTDPRLRRLLRVPDGNTTIVALRTSISYDHRDSPFVPTRGYYLSASGELASTLTSSSSDQASQFLSRFIKLQATASGYIPLGRSVVFAAQLQVGRIAHLEKDSKTYPNRAFYLGGVDSMRGYYLDELIPQDVADSALRKHNQAETDQVINAAVRSGDAFVLVRGELRFPIYGQLGGGLFADIGNLWADASNMNPFDLRPTAGAGLRLNTPVGPIAVDYGIVLNRR